MLFSSDDDDDDDDDNDGHVAATTKQPLAESTDFSSPSLLPETASSTSVSATAPATEAINPFGDDGDIDADAKRQMPAANQAPAQESSTPFGDDDDNNDNAADTSAQKSAQKEHEEEVEELSVERMSQLDAELDAIHLENEGEGENEDCGSTVNPIFTREASLAPEPAKLHVVARLPTLKANMVQDSMIETATDENGNSVTGAKMITVDHRGNPVKAKKMEAFEVESVESAPAAAEPDFMSVLLVNGCPCFFNDLPEPGTKENSASRNGMNR